MSDENTETTPEVTQPEATEETTEVQETALPDLEVSDDAPVEEPEQAPDLVSEAMKQNEALKAELEALKAQDSNIFEQNELLKKELEDAKQLQAMAQENADLQGQLESIKKNSLIDTMVASGQLNNDLKEWANEMSYEKLQTFAKSAPRVRNILQEKNPKNEKGMSDKAIEFLKVQNKARIM